MQDDRNHKRAGLWSSGFLANTFTVAIWTAVQMPPAGREAVGKRINTQKMDSPKDTIERKTTNAGIHVDLVSNLIRHAKNIWMGIDTATWGRFLYEQRLGL